MRVPLHTSNWRILVAVVLLGLSGCVIPDRRRWVIDMAPHVYNVVNERYRNTPDEGWTESFYCILGEVSGDTVFAEDVIFPQVDSARLISVFPNDKACMMSRVVGWGHTHPPHRLVANTANCFHSNEDWNFWRRYRDRYVIAMVMCERGVFQSYFRWEIPGEIPVPPAKVATTEVIPPVPACSGNPYTNWCEIAYGEPHP